MRRSGYSQVELRVWDSSKDLHAQIHTTRPDGSSRSDIKHRETSEQHSQVCHWALLESTDDRACSRSWIVFGADISRPAVPYKRSCRRIRPVGELYSRRAVVEFLDQRFAALASRKYAKKVIDGSRESYRRG